MIELKGVGSTKSTNLSIEIIKTLRKYDLNLNQVIAVTSDNGANMLKTTSLLSKCLTKFQEEEFLDNDNYQQLLEEIENDCDIDMGDITICRCAAHTAQLVAIDVIKNPNIKEFVLQCRNFTKFLRKQTNGFRCLFELNKVRVPQIDCPTRWGSTYQMIKDLKTAKPFIETQGNTTSLDLFDVNEQFWKNVDDFLVVFSPLNDILTKFQEESLHYGDFYANWLKCRLLIEKIFNMPNVNSFAKMLADLTLKFIDKRSVSLHKNDILLACIYFDPRLQHKLSHDEKERAINYLKKLWDRYISLNKEYVTKSSNSIEENNGGEEEDILTAFLRQDVIQGCDINIYTKIERLMLHFETSDCCVLDYWNKRKSLDEELFILSNIIFGVPPTQVTIERAFSSLRIILSESRNRLSPETLENILLVKLNPALLDEAIGELSLPN
ncbi:zinc finger BED domain-containing protein 4-like [Lucilia cuprina]|uniref:zinc finger BED domain-containing protein 4-like n=1 Tax=Lucilia cuprina TaxID=7375 RepID=UPI001F05221C|nr:zinc finger BED domain-containing protein 4-like [Lucilia cuprina]